LIKLLPNNSRTVQFGLFYRLLIIILFVKKSKGYDRHRSEKDIEKLVHVDIEDNDAGKKRERTIDDYRSDMKPVFKEVVADQSAILTVPLPSII
jgi:hypothetical protein